MLEFSQHNESDRRQAFITAEVELGFDRAIIEKDFWICWTLDYLFEKSEYKDRFSFKGGTSLSKAYHLIDRMSEDIDLILDWRLLGYSVDEPWEQRSNTKQDAFVEESNARAADFLEKQLMPLIEADFSKMLNAPFSISVDADDPQTLCFDYPRSFDGAGLLQQIRLETGALAAWTPASRVAVTPYIAEIMPELLRKPSTSVLTVAPERTFWEKATILHREAFRANGKMPARYSRHYYDVYKLGLSCVKDVALNNLVLLEQVVEFKMRFYRINAARYDLARNPSTLKLMPPEDALSSLKSDYNSMQSMLFGEVPSFDDVLDVIAALESEINSLGKDR